MGVGHSSLVVCAKPVPVNANQELVVKDIAAGSLHTFLLAHPHTPSTSRIGAGDSPSSSTDTQVYGWGLSTVPPSFHKTSLPPDFLLS
jgi:hypothetical protein